MPEPYHHGALREALLREALGILREQGSARLSLRAVARRAGVSHTAPYRHFRDKAGLLQALADEGFAELSAAMDRAQEEAGAAPLLRFAALGRAYIDFALADPQRFRLMFGPDVVAARHRSGQLGAAAGPFERLLAAVSSGQDGGVVRSGPVPPLALAAWSGVHGCALLLLDGLVPAALTASPDLREQLLRLCYEGLARSPG